MSDLAADMRAAIDRWVAIESAAETLMVAADNAVVTPTKRSRDRLNEATDELQQALNVPEPPTDWMRADPQPGPQARAAR